MRIAIALWGKRSNSVRRWTLAATVVLIVAASRFHPLNPAVRAAQPEKVTVHVLAERFRFSPDQIRVRRGATVEFILESDDTDHGFRILDTDIDRVIPKRGRGPLTVTYTPDKSGRYSFECSKLCGAGHEFMHGVLIVED